MYLEKAAPPSEDRRWKLVSATMRRHGYQRQRADRDASHRPGQSFGYLDQASLRFVAGSLRVPLSQAFGVATFYHFFTLKPPGEHTCVVCMGTACYIKGAQALLDAKSEKSWDSSRARPRRTARSLS